MKTNLFRVALILLTAVFIHSFAYAKEYDVDPNHSTIGFSIRHLVTTVNGRFTEFTGMVVYDAQLPKNSKVSFAVKTSSITTANDKRDTDLRSPNFFDVEKYPEATFTSTKVMPMGKNKAKVMGNLTIHGVTKPVAFDVEFLGAMKDPWGNQRAGFVATTTLDRKDFGITWNKVLDNGSLFVGNEVSMKIDVEAVEKPANK